MLVGKAGLTWNHWIVYNTWTHIIYDGSGIVHITKDKSGNKRYGQCQMLEGAMDILAQAHAGYEKKLALLNHTQANTANSNECDIV